MPLTSDFTEKIVLAIDDTVHDVLGQKVLNSLHDHLRTRYGIGREELPYRLDTLYDVLENIFGVFGAKTIGLQVARNLYVRLDLRFEATDNYTLQDYIEQAQKQLAEKP